MALAQLHLVTIEEIKQSGKCIIKEGYKIINPSGNEIQPYMTKSQAKKHCNYSKWQYKIIK